MKPFEIVVGIWVLVLFVLVGVTFASPLICTAQTTISTALIQGVPAGIIALIVAGIGSAIAYNQYRVARAKLNLDLFAQRMPIYDKTREILASYSGATRDLPWDAANEFNEMIPKATLLFGQDINAYMNLIFQKITQWNARNHQVQMGPNYATAEIAQEISDLRMWFWTQMGTYHGKFAPYLSFEEWR